MFQITAEENTIELFNRFMKHVDMEEIIVDPNDCGDCWEWVGAKIPTGYGVFEFGGTNQYAHRVSYAMFHGPIPEGLCVCHACDNPSCVNPLHIFKATQADNIADMRNKGRANYLSGEAHGRSKLTEADVTEIKKALSLGKRGIGQELAKRYGVAQSQITAIKTGKTWSKVA
jgi:hypothetical protein